MLLDKMYKYEMDPTRTLGATERTRNAGRTDGVKPIYYPPTTSLFGGYKNRIIHTFPPWWYMKRLKVTTTLERPHPHYCHWIDVGQCIKCETETETEREREREREREDRGHRDPYSPYTPCNHNLYIGIVIFPHIQSTGYNQPKKKKNN